MRETMAAHEATRNCMNCHAIFDPLGIALENFDGVGQWRNLDGVAYNRRLRRIHRWQQVQRARPITSGTAEVSGRVLLQHYAATSRVRAWSQGSSLAAVRLRNAFCSRCFEGVRRKRLSLVFDYFRNREKRAIPDEKYCSIKGNVLADCGVYLSNEGVQAPGGHLKRAFALLLLFVTPVVAQQQQSTTRNPLDQLRDQAKEVFERAGMPLSPEQEKAVSVLIEERRQASEDLFNQLMDYRGGPVQGDQHDRAVAGIKLMIDEFRKGFRECLTSDQHATWEAYESGEGAQALEQLIQ